ncbi:MAG: glycosyltransferase [Lachnospiraceae bacterium]|nr:glycosyltransferase [Lachnospiraceae bacterium]
MNKLVVITPGYISHYKPIAVFLTNAGIPAEQVVIATSIAIKNNVIDDGFEFYEFDAWKNSNPGKIDITKQDKEEADILLQSYEATKGGMRSALGFQAEHRLHDLFGRLDEIEQDINKLVGIYDPKYFMVVQLCYNVVAILEKKGMKYITFVTGNPDQLPRENELYGYPHHLPSDIRFSPEESQELLALCENVQNEATAQYTQITGTPCNNVFSVASKDMILYNFPESMILHRDINDNEFYLGSCCRECEKDYEFEKHLQELKKVGKPIIYISFGTVFSVRGDVLMKIFQALKNEDVSVVVAKGVLDQKFYKYIREDWIAEEFIPQILVLKYADLYIGHGGNNSITEALTYGVPVVVLPFASDQFFSAKAIEENQVGAVIDPNFADDILIKKQILGALAYRKKAQEIKDSIIATHTERIAEKEFIKLLEGK